ncbi:MAG: aminotransferase class V-fold PLP-dependent enzyme [Gemmatimonadaceae bacterium]
MTTRRDFVQQSMAAGALLGLRPADVIARADATAAPVAVDYYEKLGVPKIINAAGTYTYLTASLMPAEVQAAIAFAANHPVRLRDLQTAAGAYLAQKLHCESALVSSGAASALSLGTAGCMTLGNPQGAKDVPARASEFKNEVIIQKAHRFTHDHALEMCGARLIEVETAAEYERAFTPRTVMAFFFNAAEGGQISHEDWLRIAHAHAVPCFIDAAADVPPIANLWNYTKMGYDLVAFSGGKGIRGPQNAGLLLGRKDLIDSAAANNNPNDRSVGRGMKVAKEQIVGMVAAVDWLLAQSDASIDAESRRRAARIVAALRDLPTVRTEILVPAIANHVPHLMIRYDQRRIAITPLDVAAALRNGTPSIELNPATGHASGAAGLHSDENTIVVGPWMMKPGEDAIVGRRLRDVLRAALRPDA